MTDYPSLRVQLWDRLRESKFEDRLAKQDLELSDALRLLDYVSYFDGIGIPQPTETSEISHYLQEESIIKKQDNGLYSITNLGAILFGRKILEFRTVSRKALRVVQYSGTNRITLLKEKHLMLGMLQISRMLSYISKEFFHHKKLSSVRFGKQKPYIQCWRFGRPLQMP